MRLLLQQAEQLLHPPEKIDIATLRRVCTIRADDGTVALLASVLTVKKVQLVPKVSLGFIAQGQQDV